MYNMNYGMMVGLLRDSGDLGYIYETEEEANERSKGNHGRIHRKLGN